MSLERQLSELFVPRNNALVDASVASKWVRCIHDAFYKNYATVHRANKFLEMEMKLAQTFGELSAGDESDFWAFAVFVVLQLAQEKPQPETAMDKTDVVELNGTETKNPTDKKKKKKKRSQPYAPLAFMVVNALRKLTEGEGNTQQLRNCHIQGQENQVLREFCVRGLQDSNVVDQKLVVEMADLFAITDIAPQAVRDAAQSLLASKKYMALIKLFSIFSSLDWSFVSTVRTMTKWKDWSAAELLARTFGGSDNNGKRTPACVAVAMELAILTLVPAMHRTGESDGGRGDCHPGREARKIIAIFGIPFELLVSYLLYCHDGLMKLIERQRWQMALSFAGNDLSLQKLLFDHMMAAGEVQWASRLAQILAIPDFEAQVVDMVAKRGLLRTNGLSHSANAAALNGCLAFELGNESVIFCDTEESLRSAMDHLFSESNLSRKAAVKHIEHLQAIRMWQLTHTWCLCSHKNEDAELPPWQTTATEIHELVYPSPLAKEETVEAIALRHEYHQDWMNTQLKTYSGGVVASLLTSQDVEDYWEERKRKYQENELELLRSGVGADQEILDTALTFLDPHTVKGLLEQSEDSEQPVTFVAVNAICFFADGDKLDTAQLATLCGVSRRRIKLATPAECCEYFGFEPGTVPPFGHREQSDRRVRVYASSTLQYVESLVCGGGSHEALLWLNSKAYFALVEIEAIGDIQREAGVNSRVQVSADSMVARVGKWLRTIGMDVNIWDPYSVPKKTATQDHKTALLALSVCEQRILLTRDKKLANRRDAGACFVVSSDDPFKQFQEIKTHFALKLVKDEMMSRCSRCNAKGFDVVDLDYVRSQTEDEVHPNVLEVVTEFWVCRVCHKIYWEGPKYDSNYANLLRMFDEDSIVDSVCQRQ
ncbi:YbaK/aminoacyl-tRNA synthetase-associated domain [Phytophthora cactorum]|nr:YbaK/aminoacyl-tRNA synthetase-associated domain [Phytophthora cactorum]